MFLEATEKTFDRIRHSKLNAFITLNKEAGTADGQGRGRRQGQRAVWPA